VIDFAAGIETMFLEHDRASTTVCAPRPTPVREANPLGAGGERSCGD